MIALEPNQQDLYRKSTQNDTTMGGVTLPYHTCSRCHKKMSKVRKVAGTGTSRHNPIKWVCQYCDAATQDSTKE